MKMRVLLGLFFASFTLAVQAGTPGNPVTIPAPTGINLVANDSISHWSFGIEGLYVQYSGPQYQYAQLQKAGSPNSYHNETVDPSYQWGIGFDATYHFAGNDRDITFAYTEVELQNSSHTPLSSGETLHDPFGLIPVVLNRVNDIKGESYNDYNAVDLVLGQHINIGNVLDIRPFLGGRFADIESRNNSTYYNSPAAASHTQATSEMDSHFIGAGPRAGIDARYRMGSRFSFVSTAGVSLIAGHNQASTVLQTNGERPETTDYSATYVVPEIDAKLGIDYQYRITPIASIDLQLGYTAVDYMNVNYNDYTDISTPNSTNNTQDFSYQGPYIRFQLNLA
jgi:hypothetical protein